VQANYSQRGLIQRQFVVGVKSYYVSCVSFGTRDTSVVQRLFERKAPQQPGIAVS
jgi:hypothetical protein